jgi:hypothetical protein
MGTQDPVTTMPAPEIRKLNSQDRNGYTDQPVSMEELIEVWRGLRPIIH